MGKVDEFSKVLDRLDVYDKDKLLVSAHGLLKAQSAIKINSTKSKPAKKKPTKQRESI
jgi:hypothetical protein